jgi:hypothetical protein
LGLQGYWQHPEYGKQTKRSYAESDHDFDQGKASSFAQGIPHSCKDYHVTA